MSGASVFDPQGHQPIVCRLVLETKMSRLEYGEGSGVGAAVGSGVGEGVGTGVGEGVGAAVGAGVGAGVGTLVMATHSWPE